MKIVRTAKIVITNDELSALIGPIQNLRNVEYYQDENGKRAGILLTVEKEENITPDVERLKSLISLPAENSK